MHRHTYKTFKIDLIPHIECEQLKLSIQLKDPRGGVYRTFMGVRNVSIDLCKVNKGSQSMLLEIFAKNVGKYSNIMRQCPFRVS